MGASFWSYYVPHQEPSTALRDLRREVLRTGDFYWSDHHDPESQPKPTTFSGLAQEIEFTSGSGSATGAQTVYVMNADGSNQHPVHPFGYQTVPAWQPLR